MTNKLLNKSEMTSFKKKILNTLSAEKDFQNPKISDSPRAVGDAVQAVLSKCMEMCFPDHRIKDFRSDYNRRAMADMSFADYYGNEYMIDVKTHNQSTAFNRPNLTSVKRLTDYYESDHHYFMILLVEYAVTGRGLKFTDVWFQPIESIDWKCLTIGALGWGQIQVIDSNDFVVNNTFRRKDWMIELCNQMDLFYPKEKKKIESRKKEFQKIREYWEKKQINKNDDTC